MQQWLPVSVSAPLQSDAAGSSQSPNTWYPGGQDSYCSQCLLQATRKLLQECVHSHLPWGWG